MDVQARCDPAAQTHGARVDHRIRQPARIGHDRNRPVAQAIKLGQAAGLEARWHEDRIATRDHAVGQRLVIADAHRDERMVRCGRGEGAFEFGFARTKERQLPATVHEGRQRLEQQIESFLPRETRDHHGQRTVRIWQPELAPKRLAVRGLSPRRLVARPDQRIGLGIPDILVDAVQNPRNVALPRPDDALEAHPESFRPQFPRIGRRDRRDPVGPDQSCLQGTDLPPILEPRIGEIRTVELQRNHLRGGCKALEGHVVDREHAWHRCAGLRDVIGREPGLPVMAMDDIGAPLPRALGGDPRRDPGERRETLCVVRPVLPVGAQIR